MRQLRQTGWLNFRMRALLMSVASYHLWLHWREPALHLARLFTDYEPGIHYPQVQMQSGTTGINSLRIYNPLRQSQLQDPHGDYIRRWLPELAEVPSEWIHTPWLLTTALQRRSGVRLGRDYPLPLVDHERAARQAREQLLAARRSDRARREQQDILQRHGSRRRSSGRRPRGTPSDPRQQDLFADGS
jgi:deoxyribodipyrimidine photo-lyase